MPATIRQIPISLNTEKADDVLEYLDAQPNRTEAIVRAIRSQMAAEGYTSGEQR